MTKDTCKFPEPDPPPSALKNGIVVPTVADTDRKLSNRQSSPEARADGHTECHPECKVVHHETTTPRPDPIAIHIPIVAESMLQSLSELILKQSQRSSLELPWSQKRVERTPTQPLVGVTAIQLPHQNEDGQSIRTQTNQSTFPIEHGRP